MDPLATPAPPTEPLEEAFATVEAWRSDPVRFVRDVFGAEPDEWQERALRAAAVDPRVGLSACKGPGKSCVEAWIIWWWEYTREDAQAICTSITEMNLKDGLWKELAFWYAKAPVLQRAFELGALRIVHRERPKTWWVSARSWPQNADQTQQANSLAGFHGPACMVVLDEMGDYPDGVVVAAEAVFANEHLSEAKLVAAWNPTRTDGPAHRVCTKDRKRWTIISITGDPDDPKRSPRISKAWAQSMIDDWGRDNDWVRVNVLGLFPRSAEDKLLGADDITAAMGRDLPERVIMNEASIWALDVARYGSDRSVLRERCGPVAFRPTTWRGLDGPTLAQKVSHVLNDAERKPDYLLVDVGGVGASAFDHLGLLGWKPVLIPVDFGGSADDERFADKRAEMWWRMAKWVKAQGCLPADSGVLAGELTAPTFKFGVRGKRTVFILESKEQLRARGVASPDEGDSLAMTFFRDVFPKREVADELVRGRRGKFAEGYDPFKREAR